MASPLDKRFPRELKNNAGKYLGLFFMMALAVAFTSGYLLAASSIEVLLEGMRDAYNVEDGRFVADFEVARSTLRAVESTGCTVYENFSSDVDMTLANGRRAVARVYENRTQVDAAAYASGRAPERDDEVAVDRVFAANSAVALGDVVELGDRRFSVCGICTLADYQALFEDNGSFVFNALTFTVAQVTPAAFAVLKAQGVTYSYSFTFDDRAMDAAARSDAEEGIVDILVDSGVALSDVVDKDANQGIDYALDDVQGDQTLWIALLVILVVIMGFVFAVLTGAAVEAESAVIGTLLASGWRKRELIRHYATLPALVGAAACTVGLAAGFTLLADPMKDLYYNSYSLPPYEGRLDAGVVFVTAFVPYMLLMAITIGGLVRTFGCTPLQFLRHDTARRTANRSIGLPERLPFPTRLRMRVFLRNISQFVILFFGIMFASLLMLFGLCLMPVMSNFADSLEQDMPARHLYMLKAPLEIDVTPAMRDAYAAALRVADAEDALGALSRTGGLADLVTALSVDEDEHPANTLDNGEDAIAQAEKFAVAQLETERALFGANETITVYGIDPDSRYWVDVDVGEGRMSTTRGVLEKTKVDIGVETVFSDPIGGDEYRLTMTSATSSETAMEIYMARADFNRLFGNDADYFNGYASDETLALDSRYMAREATPEDMQKIALQMEDSMGDMVQMLMAIALPIYLILVYLLTKTVIDRSARPISYMKVFGYRLREINRLYLWPVTVAVLASLVLSLPVIYWLLSGLLKLVFMSYTGNFPLVIPFGCYVVIVAAGALSYSLVAFFHLRRIRRVPLALAMKAQE